MKTFFGDILIDKNKLKEEGIQYPIKVEYYKTKNEETKEYGIEIIKKEYKAENIITERKQINGITTEETKIQKMLELFKNNEVTPISAGEIIEDFFGKSIAKSIKLS